MTDHNRGRVYHVFADPQQNYTTESEDADDHFFYEDISPSDEEFRKEQRTKRLKELAEMAAQVIKRAQTEPKR